MRCAAKSGTACVLLLITRCAPRVARSSGGGEGGKARAARVAAVEVRQVLRVNLRLDQRQQLGPSDPLVAVHVHQLEPVLHSALAVQLLRVELEHRVAEPLDVHRAGVPPLVEGVLRELDPVLTSHQLHVAPVEKGGDKLADLHTPFALVTLRHGRLHALLVRQRRAEVIHAVHQLVELLLREDVALAGEGRVHRVRAD
eukprot:1139322-Prorocentrum_minimum.AAC.4